MMKYSEKGFTLVELLIAIVVIAILASITVIAFNGVQVRTDTAARISELQAWKKSFALYYAQEGRFPTMPNGGYCLGKSFPDIDTLGVGNCREAKVPGNRYSVNSTLNNEIAKISTLPSGPRTFVIDGAGAVGPYAEYYSQTYIQLKTIIKGSTCPSGTSSSYVYPNGEASVCTVLATTD